MLFFNQEALKVLIYFIVLYFPFPAFSVEVESSNFYDKTIEQLQWQISSEKVHLPLIVSGQSVGEIEIILSEESVEEIKIDTLVKLLRLEQGLAAQLLVNSENQQFIKAPALALLGFEIKLDIEELAVQIKVPLHSLQRQIIGRNSSRVQTFFHLAKEPEDFSFYLNSKMGIEHNINDTRGSESFYQVNFTSAIQYKEWVLESQAQFNSKWEEQWRQGDNRIIKYFDELNSKLFAGNIKYPVTGLQRSYPILGIGYASNNDIYSTSSTITIGDSEFELEERSKVEIWVNGQLRQSLYLERGRYQLQSLPGVTGLSDVTLKITDLVGNTSTQTFRAMAQGQLLSNKISEYGLAAGVEEAFSSALKSYTDDELITGFYRYGFNDLNTIGLNFQRQKNINFIGGEWSNLSRFGSFTWHASLSRTPSVNNGIANQIFYNFSDFKWGSFTFQLRKQSKLYGLTKDISPKYQLDKELSINYRKNWGSKFRTILASRVSRFHGEQATNKSLKATAELRLSSGWFLKLDAFRNEYVDLSKDNSLMLSISWNGFSSPHSITSQNEHYSQTSRLNYYFNPNRDPWVKNASINMFEDQLNDFQSISSKVSYSGKRVEGFYDFSQSKKSGKSQTQRHQFNLGTSIVSANNKYAWSKPVNNSFIIVDSNDLEFDEIIGVNGNSNGGYQSQIDGFGPAVISDFSPNSVKSVTAEPGDAEKFFQYNSDPILIRSGYKTGSYIKLGKLNKVLIRGQLINSNKIPIPLQAGIINKPDSTQEMFFTDESGYFEIGQLVPGKYQLELFSMPDKNIDIIIEKNDSGLLELGSLKLN